MSAPYRHPPRDEFDAEWLKRLGWAADCGHLTQHDGKELFHAVRYLRAELAATREALERAENMRPPFPADPLGSDAAEWVESRIRRAGERLARLFQENRGEGQLAAAELRRINWVVLGTLGPEVFRLRLREAALRPPTSIHIDGFDFVPIAPGPEPKK